MRRDPESDEPCRTLLALSSPLSYGAPDSISFYHPTPTACAIFCAHCLPSLTLPYHLRDAANFTTNDSVDLKITGSDIAVCVFLISSFLLCDFFLFRFVLFDLSQRFGERRLRYSRSSRIPARSRCQRYDRRLDFAAGRTIILETFGGVDSSPFRLKSHGQSETHHYLCSGRDDIFDVRRLSRTTRVYDDRPLPSLTIGHALSRSIGYHSFTLPFRCDFSSSMVSLPSFPSSLFL